MMNMNVIGSSSSGNCYILQNDNEALIIEAGIKLADVKKGLGFNTAKVCGCIISHRHNDHAGYAKEFEQAGIALLAPPDVIEAKRLGRLATAIESGKGYRLGGFKVLPFDVKHDVPCMGYLIQHAEAGRILFVTDTYALPYDFDGITHWMIEANYSDAILNRNIRNGSEHLARMKDRLMLSHMSIRNTVKILKRSDLSATRDILLIHLSDGNSDEKKFVKKVRIATGKRTYVAKPFLQMDYSIDII